MYPRYILTGSGGKRSTACQNLFYIRRLQYELTRAESTYNQRLAPYMSKFGVLNSNRGSSHCFIDHRRNGTVATQQAKVLSHRSVNQPASGSPQLCLEAN